MKRKSEQEVIAAMIPEDIFTMDIDIIEQEKEAYIAAFKPQQYRTIKNFTLTKKVLLLYNQAIAKLEGKESVNEPYNQICIQAITGEEYHIHYQERSSFPLGEQYVTNEYIIYLVKGKYKKYYENYVQKTKHYSKPDKETWKMVQYMLPNVEKHFENVDGDFFIFVKKPYQIYSLREILEYFNGSLKPEYVSSILTRLYYFVCYINLVEMTHNAITLDNLFFAPGREVEEGKKYTIEDMRIVGVYGGWFFTTYLEEKIQGLPREIYEIMPEDYKQRRYSSFEIDELAVKKLAKQLLGTEIKDAPEPLLNWLESNQIAKDAYEEFCNWEKVIISSFGGHRFVDIDVSK